MLFKKKNKNIMPSDKEEVSPGGSAIYRYEDPENQGAWRVPAEQGRFIEDVEKHFDTLFPGRETFVFHEIMSDLVHIDVHVMKPAADDDFYVIYTTGMSDIPMTIPDSIQDRENLKYSELFMYLPSNWNAGALHSLSNDMPPEDFWPIQMIKFLARFPHEYKTWLGWGHTIPNGADYEPIVQGSEMSCMLLLELGKDFTMTAKNGECVKLYMSVPITQSEAEYKLEHGTSALVDKFSEHGLPLVVDIFRKSTV